MRRVCLVFVAALITLGQVPQLPPEVEPPGAEQPDHKLPNGKSQREEILKADYKKNMQDADQLVKLSQEVKDEVDKGDGYVVSVKTLKNLDDIEKLAKSIRGRLKRY